MLYPRQPVDPTASKSRATSQVSSQIGLLKNPRMLNSEGRMTKLVVQIAAHRRIEDLRTSLAWASRDLSRHRTVSSLMQSLFQRRVRVQLRRPELRVTSSTSKKTLTGMCFQLTMMTYGMSSILSSRPRLPKSQT